MGGPVISVSCLVPVSVKVCGFEIGWTSRSASRGPVPNRALLSWALSRGRGRSSRVGESAPEVPERSDVRGARRESRDGTEPWRAPLVRR